MSPVWIEVRGDTDDAVWEETGDEFDNFYDGMAALWQQAARDLYADWAPERRLAVYHRTTDRTKYFKATYIEVFDDLASVL